MDPQTKQALLHEVIEYAVRFQKHRRRKYLAPVDIEDAIHALGFRPLFSTVTGNDTVNPLEVISEPLGGNLGAIPNLSVTVPVEAVWSIPKDNFRKRKTEVVKNFHLALSNRTKVLVNGIVNACHTNGSIPTGISDKEVLVTAWMLGLYFSDLVAKTSIEIPIEWQFIRNSLWFLERAKVTYERVMRNSLSASFENHVAAPWISGLERLADGSVEIICVSEGQKILISNTCRRLAKEISSHS